jgi:hypothetical protein
MGEASMSSGGAGRLTGNIVGALTQDVSGLVREELRAAQAELTAKARRAGRGGALLAGAGVLGALAAGSSAALLLRVLDRVLPPRTAAGVMTLLYAGGAAALGAAGVAELRRAMPLVPEDTITSLREDVQAAAPGQATVSGRVADADPHGPGGGTTPG